MSISKDRIKSYMESWELSSYLEPGRFIIQLLVVSVLVPWTIKELNQDSLIYSCSCSILGSIQVLFLVLSMVLFLFLFYPWFYSCSIPGSILGSIPVLSLVLSSCIPFYPRSIPVLPLFYPLPSFSIQLYPPYPDWTCYCMLPCSWNLVCMELELLHLLRSKKNPRIIKT